MSCGNSVQSSDVYRGRSSKSLSTAARTPGVVSVCSPYPDNSLLEHQAYLMRYLATVSFEHWHAVNYHPEQTYQFMFDNCKTSAFHTRPVFSLRNSRLSVSHRLTFSVESRGQNPHLRSRNPDRSILTRADEIAGNLHTVGQIAHLMGATSRNHDRLSLLSPCDQYKPARTLVTWHSLDTGKCDDCKSPSFRTAPS